MRHGIGAVQDQKISVTKRSVNLIKEYRNYLWDTDKDGNILAGVPAKRGDHALDAVRYPINSLMPVIRKREMLPPFHSTPRVKVNIAV